jgi:hypothetical protein
MTCEYGQFTELKLRRSKVDWPGRASGSIIVANYKRVRPGHETKLRKSEWTGRDLNPGPPACLEPYPRFLFVNVFFSKEKVRAKQAI